MRHVAHRQIPPNFPLVKLSLLAIKSLAETIRVKLFKLCGNNRFEIGIEFLHERRITRMRPRRDWLIEKNYQTADNHYLAFQTSSNEIERKHGLFNLDVEFSFYFFFFLLLLLFFDLFRFRKHNREKEMAEKRFLSCEIRTSIFFDNLEDSSSSKFRILERKIQSILYDRNETIAKSFHIFRISPKIYFPFSNQNSFQSSTHIYIQ